MMNLTRLNNFFPENKKFNLRRSIKNDCLYFDSSFEYKITTNPTEIYIRLLEDFSEPPEKIFGKERCGFRI